MLRITDKEYLDWQEMSSLARNENYWIYFSPDNLHAALVNRINQEIIFISERKTGLEIYKSRNAKKHAQFFRALQQFRRPERVI